MKTSWKISHISILLAVILVAVHSLAPIAFAHPLGNFTVNHYVGLQLNPEIIVIDFVLDMAEVPAFQEIAAFDTNKDSQPDPTEAAGYHAAKCKTLQPDLVLYLEGRPLTLKLVSSTVEFPAGAGGLPTLRLSCHFQGPMPALAGGAHLQFNNTIDPERLGWREITVTGEGLSLPAELLPLNQSLSQRLTSYPEDLLSSPLDQRQLSFTFHPSDDSTQSLPGLPAANLQTNQPLIDRNDGFTQLITLQNLTLPTFMLAIAVAFTWGAAHALTPGHGKTIVAAYLVGSRGTARHALFLGLTTTMTHTAGVFMLGFLTLFAARFVLPEQLYPWLGVASGLLVVGIGLSLFRGRLLGLSGSDHQHDHDHPHFHDYPHRHEHGDDHHWHGLTGHSHLPPGGDNTPITWRSLLALGVSGGLIPCPSALIVMLSAIALQRIGFGLVLIIAFSLGLAAVLTAIGIVWVQARQLFEYLPRQRYLLNSLSRGSRILQLLPAASAAFIMIAGLGITFQALTQMGLLS